MAIRTYGYFVKKRIELRPNFPDIVGRYNLSLRAVARAAEMDPAALHHILNPNPRIQRKNGMHPRTAWRIARAFAKLTDLDEEAAYQHIITVVEETEVPTQPEGEANIQ